jgi:hypothetical protein
MIVPSLIVYHSWGGANPSTAHGIMIVHTCMAQACHVLFCIAFAFSVFVYVFVFCFLFAFFVVFLLLFLL